MMDWIGRDNSLDPGQIEMLRLELERYARTTRRVLQLVDELLGVEGQRPDLARENDLLVEHHEALARVEALAHDLETARAWISVLQDKIAEMEDEASDSYAKVGLRSTVHDVVLAAGRRALLAHYHPDKAAADDKARMGVLFKAASAAFDEISADRRC